jgi:hypothetical protein
MNFANVNDWLLLISIFPTLIGVWLSLNEYRLKLQAERRLAESAKAETDIRLLQLFTEVLYIASGRKGEPIFSKEILDLLVQKNILTDDDFKDLDVLKSKISQATLLAQVPGATSSNAAFASIATLAVQHPILRASAIEALESFKNQNWNLQLSEKYLDFINHSTSKTNKAG